MRAKNRSKRRWAIFLLRPGSIDFDIQPLASASIARVHTASGKRMAKKSLSKLSARIFCRSSKRDMKLIYRLARWVPASAP
ncbi:hypothetical protein KIF59_21655 [Enterobacter cloacae subsp. cloacae]|nr:hypothetical protein [Enterobacter cloacae subsp. cloacae]